jgi:hypothetical protein
MWGTFHFLLALVLSPYLVAAPPAFNGCGDPAAAVARLEERFGPRTVIVDGLPIEIEAGQDIPKSILKSGFTERRSGLYASPKEAKRLMVESLKDTVVTPRLNHFQSGSAEVIEKFERIAANIKSKLGDNEGFASWIEKLVSDADKLAEKRVVGKTLTDEERAIIKREAVLDVLKERGKPIGWDKWGEIPVGCCSSPAQFAEHLAKGVPFIDHGVGDLTHGYDTHILQLFYVSEGTANGEMSGFMKQLAVDSNGGRLWNELFDSGGKSLASPEHVRRITDSILGTH